jgi:drug/metabolite transporter (DMT)-like permease
MAFNRGDVSVVTPILGTKVIWVAAFSVLLVGRALPSQIWAAVFLTALGTAVMGYQPGAHPRRLALSIGAALATSCSFGLTDVLVQKYSPAWGFGSFIPTMFMTVGVLSLGFLPFLGEGGWAPVWLGTGSAMLAVQALAMAYAISTYTQVTMTNIAYNTRGLWSIALIWAFGHWFKNTERDRGTRTMLLRLGGASLLVTAIFIASAR